LKKAKQVQPLTHSRLREYLTYDETSGRMTMNIKVGGRGIGDEAGSHNAAGYRQVMIDRRVYLGHRLAWLYVHGEWPNGYIDHINGDKSDNRIANLRACSMSQNLANTRRPRHNTSGFKGVSWSRMCRKWQAHIMVQQKSVYLGLYLTKEDAHAAYLAAAEQKFGAFANGGSPCR
jgi:hypothetical protein